MSASDRLDEWLVMITAIATAIGAVGPEICDRVPPNTAAKNPTAMAPYSPAAAPSPDERQRNRQRHHRRREAAEHVSAQRIEVVLHRLCVLNLDTSSGTISAEPNPC